MGKSEERGRIHRLQPGTPCCSGPTPARPCFYKPRCGRATLKGMSPNQELKSLEGRTSTDGNDASNQKPTRGTKVSEAGEELRNVGSKRLQQMQPTKVSTAGRWMTHAGGIGTTPQRESDSQPTAEHDAARRTGGRTILASRRTKHRKRCETGQTRERLNSPRDAMKHRAQGLHDYHRNSSAAPILTTRICTDYTHAHTDNNAETKRARTQYR